LGLSDLRHRSGRDALPIWPIYRQFMSFCRTRQSLSNALDKRRGMDMDAPIHIPTVLRAFILCASQVWATHLALRSSITQMAFWEAALDWLTDLGGNIKGIALAIHALKPFGGPSWWIIAPPSPWVATHQSPSRQHCSLPHTWESNKWDAVGRVGIRFVRRK